MRNPSVSADPQSSPFLLPPASAHALRTHLKTLCPTKTTVFCPSHTRAATTPALKTYLLHHAALRALLRPVYNLLSRATRLAHSVTRSADLADLERTFRGHARTAYLWYTCLEDDEAAWLYSAVGSRTMKPSLRCPACVVDRTLHTETTIRLALAACRLAEIRAEVSAAYADPATPSSSSSSSSSDDEDEPPEISHDAALALVAHHLAPAISESLSLDPFWRPAGIRADAPARAHVLAESMWCLEEACGEIEALLGGFWADRVESPGGEEFTGQPLLGGGYMTGGFTTTGKRRSVVEAFVREWVRQHGEVEVDVEVEVVDDDDAAPGRKGSCVALAGRPPLARARSVTS